MPKVIGISGSTVKNSATDGLVKIAMEATGMEPIAFIKLVDYKITPCIGCTVLHPDLGYIVPCQIDNECIIKDDWQMIISACREADAIILGTNPTLYSMNAITKLFIERTICINHTTATKDPPMPLAGKIAAAVVLCNTVMDGKHTAEYAELWFNEMMMSIAGSIIIQGSWACQFAYQCCVNRRTINPIYSGGQATARFNPPSEPWCEERCKVREPLKDEAVIEQTRRLGLKIHETYRMLHEVEYPLISKLPKGFKLEKGGDRYGNTPAYTCPSLEKANITTSLKKKRQ